MIKLKKRTIIALVFQVLLFQICMVNAENENTETDILNSYEIQDEAQKEIEMNSPIKQFKQKIDIQTFHFKSSDQEEYFYLKFEMKNLKLKEQRDVVVSVQEIDSGEVKYIDYEGQFLKSKTLQIIGNLKPNRDYLIVVSIKDKQPLEYDIIITSSLYFHCPSNCSLNGVCNKQKQMCECSPFFIGNSCNVQTNLIKETKSDILQVLDPKQQVFYQYFDHFQQENIDQVQIIIFLPEKIQQEFIADLYLSSGNFLATPTQSFTNYINPIQEESQKIFKIIVDKEHLYNQKGEPIPLNLSISSSSEKQTIFYIQIDNIRSGYVQQVVEVIINEYIFVILAIVLLLFVLSFLKYQSNKNQQEPTLLKNKVKNNLNDSLPITNEYELKHQELATPQFDSINQCVSHSSPNDKLKTGISPRRKFHLGQIKTLNLEIIDIYMPAQTFYGYIFSQFKNTKSQEHQESVDQNLIKTDTSPHYKDDDMILRQLYKKHSKCQVCKFDLKKNDIIRNTICQHVVHDQCLVYWLSNNEECPKCKQSLSKISLYQHEIDTKQHYKRENSE